MRSIFLIATLFAMSLAVADDASDAGAKLYEYFEVFNARDTQRIATSIYSTPVHIGGGSGHRVLARPADAVENLTNLYEQIEAQGWKESVIDDLRICVLSATLALVDTRYSRMTHDGEPIPPAVRTTLYVLQKLDGEWRIVNILWAPYRIIGPNRTEAEEEARIVPDARDSAQVVAQALNYIQGSFTGDAGRMESALHPELTKVRLAYDRVTHRPYLSKMGASNLIEGTLAGMGMVPEDEWHIDVEIQDLSRGIAAVKVTSSMYIDHLQMGKVNGAWKIINVLWVPNPEMPRLRPSMRR